MDLLIDRSRMRIFNFWRPIRTDVPRSIMGRSSIKNGVSSASQHWFSRPADRMGTTAELKHDPEKLADLSDKIMRQNKENESAIDSM